MGRREPLNRERVLVAALALADKEGLAGLSMRRLAKVLGVEAMALYNHVSNKADLLDGIAEQVFASVERAGPDLPWAERLRVTALSMYRALSRHPVVPLALVADRANPTSQRALQPLEDIVAALYEAGFKNAEVGRALGAITSLLFGALVMSSALFAGGPDRRPQREQLDIYVRKVDPNQLPHFSRYLSAAGVDDPEKAFDWALGQLIAGLVEARGGRRGPRAPSRRR